MAAVGTTDKGHEANERPLLGLSEKQRGDYEGSKQADTAKSEVNYTSHEHTQNRLQQVTYQ